MTPWSRLPLLCALIALGWPFAARADDGRARSLRFNPFARPDLSAAAAVGAPGYAVGDPSGWAPVLTATLAAGEESLANLGGVILEIGEEVHGYRLVEVDVFEAVFEKDGATLVLQVEARDRLEAR